MCDLNSENDAMEGNLFVFIIELLICCQNYPIMR